MATPIFHINHFSTKIIIHCTEIRLIRGDGCIGAISYTDKKEVLFSL